MIGALVTAVKYNEDRFYKMSNYAKMLGNITFNEFLELDYTFIAAMEYDCYVSDESYVAYIKGLIKSLK